MTTNTYVALDKATVSGTSTTTITFTVPSGYTDLFIVTNARNSTSGGTDYFMRFNSDTASNYSYVQMIGNGSTAASDKAGSASQFNIGYVAGTSGTAPTICRINIQNYLNTTTNKTILYNWNSQGADAKYVLQGVGLWRKAPEAITSISIYTTSGNIVAGSTFSLYGVASADAFAKATGGIVTYDSNYFYHTFGATGTFTPKQSLTCDVLVVAGGGGGSRGGGGAGGVAYYASQSLTATGYTCTVGGGGAGSVDSEGGGAAKGTSGVNSSFTGLTAAVGGGGAGADASSVNNGLNGGSGGGSGYGRPSSDTRATGTSGQGSSGGLALSDSTTYTSGGGGGGAGAQGGDVNSGTKTGGVGGVGISTYSSWGTVTGIGENVSGTYYLAGGGGGGGNNFGGGSAGLGGGGAGTNGITLNNGLSNTGGGGGGGGDGVLTRGNGGSGVVIVRYAK